MRLSMNDSKMRQSNTNGSSKQLFSKSITLSWPLMELQLQLTESSSNLLMTLPPLHLSYQFQSSPNLSNSF
jgi:hypothetical protein